MAVEVLCGHLARPIIAAEAKAATGPGKKRHKN
jgi:hypothetical protein